MPGKAPFRTAPGGQGHPGERGDPNDTTNVTNATSTTSTATPGPDELRAALGQFVTGVTVVTGLDEDGPVGFACQSFASVSLRPPLVLFCADHGGRAWPRIRAAGRFCVNVLTEHQTELCTRFGSRRGRKYEGLAWEESPWGAPRLPDVLVRVHAEVRSVQTAGDHDVVIGRVLALESVAEAQPMIYFRGGFGLPEGHERNTGGGSPGPDTPSDGETATAGWPGDGGTTDPASRIALAHSWGWGDNWG